MADDLERVLQLPAITAIVLEAGHVLAEVEALLEETVAADGILQVGINLHFLSELWCLDLDEGSSHRLHVAFCAIERDTARSDRIFVAVSVNS